MHCCEDGDDLPNDEMPCHDELSNNDRDIQMNDFKLSYSP